MNIFGRIICLQASLLLGACNLTVVNNGGGVVTSESGSIDCGETCVVQHNTRTPTIEVLHAQPDEANGYEFLYWIGPCTETDLNQPTCSVPVGATSGNKNVKAIFAKNDGIAVSPFSAKYYSGIRLVASEEVPVPSIKYVWSDFNGIESYDFNATWEGYIDVAQDSKTIDIEFSLSWSDVVLTIDDVVVSQWSNEPQTIPYEFTRGRHSIKIQYANNWHTTNFKVAFKDNPKYTISEMASTLPSLVDGSTNVVYVGSYEALNLKNDIHVSLAGLAGPVFLFFTSYNAVNWVIDNPDNLQIVGVGYNSYMPATTVETQGSVPFYEISDFQVENGWSDAALPRNDIRTMIGRSPNTVRTNYSWDNVTFTN